MGSISDLLFHDGKLFGIEWNAWKVVGWLGNAVFFSRFLVQWFATERKKKVVVPTAFWWLSLFGALLLLSYAACYKHDSVFIFAYLFSWIPYTRNLIIHYRHAEAHRDCANCGSESPPEASYCAHCGAKLAAQSPAGTLKHGF